MKEARPLQGMLMTEAGENSAAANVPQPSWRRRWLRRLVVALVLAAVLVVFRQPILQGLAGLLILDEPYPPQFTVLVLNPDASLDVAARLWKDGKTKEIVVMQRRLDRVQQLGIVSSHAVALRQILGKQGVPDRVIKNLPGEPRDLYELADQLGDWLERHPGQHLVVCCHRFGSRQFQIVLNAVLGEDRQRVHLCAVAHPEYDESDWWRHKAGLKDFWQGVSRLAFTWTHGRPPHDRPRWDPDTYEKSLQ